MVSNLPEVAQLINVGADLYDPQAHPQGPRSYKISVPDLYIHNRILFRRCCLFPHHGPLPLPSCYHNL